MCVSADEIAVLVYRAIECDAAGDVEGLRDCLRLIGTIVGVQFPA